MESGITDEQLDAVLQRAKKIAEEDETEFTEERVLANSVKTNPATPTGPAHQRVFLIVKG
jgi:hypothetical protein